jgi:hypothetical protein
VSGPALLVDSVTPDEPRRAPIRSQVSNVGERDPVSISRYSRTLIPRSHAARQTRRPSRFRARRIIRGYTAKVDIVRSLVRGQDISTSLLPPT